MGLLSLGEYRRVRALESAQVCTLGLGCPWSMRLCELMLLSFNLAGQLADSRERGI